MNTFGHLFRVTSFGESHGEALGAVIDGCPPGIPLTQADIQTSLNRRRPGQSPMATPRKESDTARILSGVFEGRTTGAPIAVIVENQNQRSQDYDAIKDIFRPSHADFGFLAKYGVRDHRGGGRSSGRETIARVIGGAVAMKVLEKFGIDIFGFARAIGGAEFPNVVCDFIEQNPLRMADPDHAEEAIKRVEALKAEGDSLGGIVEMQVHGAPAGLGSPVFGKLEAELARACLSVGATKGFEMGEGFSLAGKTGATANDPFVAENETYRTQRNANGGVLGGITTGDAIWFRVAVKPTSSISKEQTSANVHGENVPLSVKGRHDPIIVPRVIPVLEAMTAMTILDALMVHQAQCGLPLDADRGGA